MSWAKSQFPRQSAFVADAVEDERDHGALDVVKVFGRQATNCQGVSYTFLVDAGKVHPCRGPWQLLVARVRVRALDRFIRASAWPQGFDPGHWNVPKVL
jgi:hypothetical protein